MDNLTFASNLISSLVWPVVAFALIYLFRKEVSQLFHTLRDRLSHARLPGGIELSFSQQINELSEATNEADLGQPQYNNIASSALNIWLHMANVSPTAAVLDAWRGVEGALKRVAENQSLTEKEGKTITGITRSLAKRGLLNTDLVAAISDLRGIRNSVAHSSDVDISKEDSILYAQIAQKVIYNLNS